SFEVELAYFDRGPHQYDRADEVPDAEEGSLPSYEFHWTAAEFITTIIDSGCEVLRVAEVGQGLDKWINITLTGLPQSLMILSRKK
ncbi:MAG: hypothetical protein J7M14_07070, partial [Planctomycetes bacterium]|nr:hypothetical protein [Planctomycetota bacterium]